MSAIGVKKLGMTIRVTTAEGNVDGVLTFVGKWGNEGNRQKNGIPFIELTTPNGKEQFNKDGLVARVLSPTEMSRDHLSRELAIIDKAYSGQEVPEYLADRYDEMKERLEQML